MNVILGVYKAYCTRVGGGPFPTELKDAVGDQIRERAHEFGTTTDVPAAAAGLTASLPGSASGSTVSPGWSSPVSIFWTCSRL